MQTKDITENWEEKKAKLKQKFTLLTDSDLHFIEGKKEELIGRLQTKLNKTKEEILSIIGKL